jgi:hypothetical protein
MTLTLTAGNMNGARGYFKGKEASTSFCEQKEAKKL